MKSCSHFHYLCGPSPFASTPVIRRWPSNNFNYPWPSSWPRSGPCGLLYAGPRIQACRGVYLAHASRADALQSPHQAAPQYRSFRRWAFWRNKLSSHCLKLLEFMDSNHSDGNPHAPNCIKVEVGVEGCYDDLRLDPAHSRVSNAEIAEIAHKCPRKRPHLGPRRWPTSDREYHIRYSLHLGYPTSGSKTSY